MTSATDVSVLRERVRNAIEAERDYIVEDSETFRINPEFHYEEFKASQLLADQLREAAFEVEKPYKGLKAAFCATRKGRGDRQMIAARAKYDAWRARTCGRRTSSAN